PPEVNIDGYYRSGDGGGGKFIWRAKSAAQPDGGLVFASELPNAKGKGMWERVWAGALNVRWFGAQGDGKTDDYDALLAATEAINAGKSNVLYYPSGVYRINRIKQTDSNPSKIINNDIAFTNCNGLRIYGYSAVIDVKGDFERSVASVCSVQPFVFKSCSDVVMDGFELNGNVDKMSRANFPYAAGGNGITFGRGSKNYTLKNIYVHHFPNDGIYLGESDPRATYAKPAPCDQSATLDNVVAKFNARDGLTCASLKGGRFVDCEFSENGRASG